MKYLKILPLLLLPLFAAAQPLGTWPVQYGDTPPTHTPSGSGTRIYLNISTNELYNWNPAPVSSWVKYPKGFDQISGCAAPGYTPTARQSVFAVNSCTALQNGRGPELYQYTGSQWVCLNCYPAYTAGTGISISGGEINNTGDLSNTNELQSLSVSGGTISLSNGGGSVQLPSEYVNIVTLGAVGDGSTNNTNIIRSAFLQNKAVYVPPGVFVCDSIVVPEGRSIIGAGENSILLFRSGQTGRFIDCRNGNISISNISISGSEGSSAYNTTTSSGTRIGVYVKGDNNNAKLTNIWIRGFDAAGVSGNGGSGNRDQTVVVSNVSIKNCFTGINTNQGGANGCEYIRILGCNIGGCRVGIDLNSGNGIVSGNTISDNAYGIIVKSGGSGGNSGHGNIVNNLINHSDITGLVLASTSFGFNITGNNIFLGGIDITGDGVVFTSNVLGFQSGDSLMLRSGSNCQFTANYVATSFSQTTSISSAWAYANNRQVGGAYIDNLFFPVFNSSASYNLSTNVLTAPTITATTRLINQVGSASNVNGYIKSSNSAASTTSLNPGLLVYETGGGFPHGIDMGYNSVSSRYRTRMFSNNDLALSTVGSSPTQQSDFTDRVVIRGDNGRVGIPSASPSEMLDVTGNIKASGNLIGTGLNVSGDVTFGGRVTAVAFRQSATSGSNLSNYFRTSNNAVSTTSLNPGIVLYESGNGFAHGFDLGYSNSRFRARIFSNNDISFAYAPNTAVSTQSDFVDMMTIRGDSKSVGIGTQSPASSAILELSSTSKGFLPTRVTLSQRDAISSPSTGLTLYCTDCTATDTSTGVMQTYNGSTWKNNW